LIASSTATVRDGSAPAAPVRNADATPAAVVPKAAVLEAAVLEAAVLEAAAPEAAAPEDAVPRAAVPEDAVLEASGPPEADGKDGMWGVDIMYRISYMTEFRA
jgi:hypothetical protein